MLRAFLICFFIGASMGGIAYLVTESFYFLAAVFLLFFCAFFFVISPMIHRFLVRHRKRHESYGFINSFIVTLSVTASLEKAYASAFEGTEGEEKDILLSLEEYPVIQRVEYLASYFHSSLFDMFLSVLHIYLEQGGDILALSSLLLEEATRVEDAGNQIRKESLGVFVQYLLLWLMALAVLAFLRFGLANFYGSLVKSPLFLASIGVFFLYLLGSSLFYAFRYTGEKPTLSLKLAPKKRRKAK